MSDVADIAGEYEERHHAASLRAQQARARAAAAAAPLACDDCVDCGDLIPPARRAAQPNASRCVDCQSVTDRRLR